MKKYTTHILLAILGLLLFYYLLILKKYKILTNTFTLKSVFDKIKNTYGEEIAKMTEKVARLESAHFTDSKALITNNYGFMLAFSHKYPYGWLELKDFWEKNNIKPSYYDASNGYSYLKFDTAEQGLLSVAEKLAQLKAAGKNYGAYHSKLPEAQVDYLEKLNKIKTYYT